MISETQRIIVKAKPAKENRLFYDWQTATLVLFVRENDRDRARLKAREKIKAEKWVVLEVLKESTLIEDRVKEAGGEVLAAYEEAKRDNISFRIFRDDFGAGKDRLPPVPMPRFGEEFIDAVIVKADGRRLRELAQKHAQTRNADYLIDGYIVELKDLQEEGFGKPSRQAKLANLFRPYFPSQAEIAIDPEVLSDSDRLKYMDTVGGPIQTQVKSASDQIKKTAAQLNLQNRLGGLIYMNSGYGSLPPELFETLVVRYAAKDSKHIGWVICISVWVLTNGWESEVHFQLYPRVAPNPTVEKIEDAFGVEVQEWMNAWLRSGFNTPRNSMNPLAPIAFEQGGVGLSWSPPKLPLSWQNKPAR